ncbi:MAG: AAA family ATPase, partial [Haliscomenobacter sp.]|nr:AAA family ATPase [Haliscomenobacter sp.]
KTKIVLDILFITRIFYLSPLPYFSLSLSLKRSALMFKKIPICLQDFRKIIENGFLYVDKTAYIYITAWETIQI